MANNIGTLIIAPVRPQADNDAYPSAFANEIKGGHHQVTSLTERDLITTDRRELGMLCSVVTISSSNTYQLIGGIDNINWSEFITPVDLAPVFSNINEISSNFDERISILESQPSQDLSLRSEVTSISSGFDQRIDYLENASSTINEAFPISGSNNIVDFFSNTLGDGCEWLVTIKSDNNVRISDVLAIWDSISNVEYTETATNDLGDTSAVVFSVIDESNVIKLIADVTSGTWEVNVRRTLINNIASGEVSLDVLQDIYDLRTDVNTISGNIIRKFTSLIGNNTDNVIVVTHNLNTKDISITLRENSTGQVVTTDTVISNNNFITLTFAITPINNEYAITILG